MKENIGRDGIEIQLLGELIEDREKGIYKCPFEVFDLFGLARNHNISAVHAPLIYGEDDILLEMLCSSKYEKLLDGICYIANFFGELKKTPIVIIIHTEMSVTQLKGLSNHWERITTKIEQALKMYPYIEFAIENVTPFRRITDDVVHLSNNFSFENVELAKTLREVLDTDRIGTCLDICHAELSEKYAIEMHNMLKSPLKVDLSLKAFFETNRDVIKLIHLCHYSGNGYDYGTHGVRFTEETYPLLEEILGLHEKYTPKCPITLEIFETDYLVCDGYAQTKQLVDRYYKEKE